MEIVVSKGTRVECKKGAFSRVMNYLNTLPTVREGA